MKTLAQRIQIAREAAHLTQAQLAELAGIKQQSLQKIESGKTKRSRHIIKIAEILRVDPGWLQFGTGRSEFNQEIKDKEEGIPLISWSDAADFCFNHQLFLKREVIEYIPIFRRKDRSYALKIKSDSMISSIPGKRSFMEGDIIIVDPDKEPKTGDYVIAVQSGAEEATFKQYIIDGADKFLKPLNPQYPIIKLDKHIKLCGVVIAHLDVMVTS